MRRVGARIPPAAYLGKKTISDEWRMVLGDGDRDWCRDGQPNIIVVILATTAVAIMATTAVAIMATTMATTIVTIKPRHGFCCGSGLDLVWVTVRQSRSQLASSLLHPSEQPSPLPEELALPPSPSPLPEELALPPLPSALPKFLPALPSPLPKFLPLVPFLPPASPILAISA